MNNRKPKVYISAPITGYDLDERRKSFAQWAKVLVDAGCEPVNPLENGVPEDASYREHIKADISLLLECDGYILSTLWMNSRGCKCENAVASACGIKFVGFIKADDVEFVTNNLKSLKAEVRRRK